ncbi:drug resistance transporter, EmrB/QacA subfamily [Alicyclobacillus vulcanalis]|uniref:Drug resistance transporter, EmrB/QacA subfamily n=1 Tax=Alicyclobacillus vulcanalis TaxID=252246 RepID=A0A1N7MCB7_9BACL|nr:drug resistance transporter, EmrB/QacA subfamily [Alicyclobacillus vulcanalis]
MDARSPAYKWIALSNTTLGVLMASINGTILIIALPVIFAGIRVNPLQSGQTSLLLWVLMGFNVATTVLLVTFGRLSDMYGRVRLYNLGFLVFTLGSVLCSLTWSHGRAGEWELIIFRMIQGIGGAFLFSNSAAILTDAFPNHQRGLALGLNQIAAVAGSVVGLVLGGILASTGHWRYVFLVNVPIGVLGTIWAYLMLKEIAKPERGAKLDIPGNVTLALGVLALMLALTYGIMPYGGHSMGWSSPMVLALFAGGIMMLVVFGVIERRMPDPLFHLGLFRIRPFTLGNVALFMGSLARGGLSFMLIIWLQGIYLPLHGVSYANTPLIAGLYTLPQMIGFLAAGPISGYLSDKFGQRAFATGGLLVSAVGFVLLAALPIDFNRWAFWADIFVIGVGMGLFASPNNASIMSSVPARFRGVASGMRSTFNNAGQMMSMGIFFSIVVAGLAANLPHALMSGLEAHGVPSAAAEAVAKLPPTSSLFAALLGYNPLASLLGQGGLGVLAHLPASEASVLTGKSFFPHLISGPFHAGLALAFLLSAALMLVGAVASLFRGTYQPAEADEAQEPARMAK